MSKISTFQRIIKLNKALRLLNANAQVKLPTFLLYHKFSKKYTSHHLLIASILISSKLFKPIPLSTIIAIVHKIFDISLPISQEKQEVVALEMKILKKFGFKLNFIHFHSKLIYFIDRYTKRYISGNNNFNKKYINYRDNINDNKKLKKNNEVNHPIDIHISCVNRRIYNDKLDKLKNLDEDGKDKIIRIFNDIFLCPSVTEYNFDDVMFICFLVSLGIKCCCRLIDELNFLYEIDENDVDSYE